MASSRSFSMRQLPSLCLIVFALLRTANAECYYPTGVTANVVAGVYTSCNATASASMCCNLQNGDKCTPEGLCLSGSNAFYRDMCTDQTWKAPECIQLCTDIWNPRVTQCPDGTWCCGPGPDGNVTACCDAGLGLKLSATGTATLPYSPSSTTSTPSATTTAASTTSGATSSQTSTPVDKSASGGKKNNSLAIGVGIGISGVVLVVAIIAGLWFWRRRQKNKRAEFSSAETDDKKRAPDTAASTEGSPMMRHEREAIEDGSVMAGLATGGSGLSPAKKKSIGVHSFGGEIHEMSSRDNFHEMSGEDRRMGVQNSIEKF